MEFAKYGNSGGRLVIYFHGAPGAVEECAIFDSYAKQHDLNIVCFDRFSADKSLDRAGYYQYLASQIQAMAHDDPVDIIGFSIGAHVALEVGGLLRNQVRQTHLVSAAAPINAGHFIDDMAGRLIFKLAMEKPLALSVLMRCQKIMALLAPNLLVNMLFASSTGEDKALSKRRAFKRYITPILVHCFRRRANGYSRDLNLYLTWPSRLRNYNTSVHIWHGTEDNWSPFAMASYLYDVIPGATRIEALETLSHYSCLFEAAPRICAQLEKTEDAAGAVQLP